MDQDLVLYWRDRLTVDGLRFFGWLAVSAIILKPLSALVVGDGFSPGMMIVTAVQVASGLVMLATNWAVRTDRAFTAALGFGSLAAVNASFAIVILVLEVRDAPMILIWLGVPLLLAFAVFNAWCVIIPVKLRNRG